MYRPMLCIPYIHSTDDLKRLCCTIVCDMWLNACKVICSDGRRSYNYCQVWKDTTCIRERLLFQRNYLLTL